MGFFKRLFGRSSDKKTEETIVNITFNFNPDTKLPDSGTLIASLSPKTMKAIANGFKNLGHKESKLVFDEMSEKCVASNDPEAPNMLAMLYALGVGVEPDLSRAVELFRESADKGSEAAMNNLAKYYASEQMGNDMDEAIGWYRRAAEKGFASSQAALGMILKERQQYNEAFKWLKKGAEQGNSDAEYTLGVMHGHGYGVECDEKKAFEWYKRAAEQGHARAQSDVAVCYANGEGVEKDEQQMAYWYNLSAQQGDPVGLRGMALCYAYGTGVEQNSELALKYLDSAANAGNVAQVYHDLGASFYNEGDFDNAILCFTKGAEGGFARSQYELGLLYSNGKGVRRDMNLAKKWYEKAAVQGHISAQCNLGVVYLQLGDYAAAVKWTRRAAKQGYLEALSNLAACYIDGTGVEQNISKGLSLLHAAANKGDEYSANILNNYSENFGFDYRIYILTTAFVDNVVVFPAISNIIPDNFDNQELLLKECEEGETNSQVFVGLAYIEGRFGFEKNKDEGFKWIETSARNGNSRGQNILGIFYLNSGENETAIELLRQAAAGFLDSAMYNLGMCHVLGVGVPKDVDEAIAWLEKAKKYGSGNARTALSYLEGDICLNEDEDDNN